MLPVHRNHSRVPCSASDCLLAQLLRRYVCGVGSPRALTTKPLRTTFRATSRNNVGKAIAQFLCVPSHVAIFCVGSPPPSVFAFFNHVATIYEECLDYCEFHFCRFWTFRLVPDFIFLPHFFVYSQLPLNPPSFSHSTEKKECHSSTRSLSALISFRNRRPSSVFSQKWLFFNRDTISLRCTLKKSRIV